LEDLAPTIRRAGDIFGRESSEQVKIPKKRLEKYKKQVTLEVIKIGETSI
jgi:hypothetical protein